MQEEQRRRRLLSASPSTSSSQVDSHLLSSPHHNPFHSDVPFHNTNHCPTSRSQPCISPNSVTDWVLLNTPPHQPSSVSLSPSSLCQSPRSRRSDTTDIATQTATEPTRSNIHLRAASVNECVRDFERVYFQQLQESHHSTSFPLGYSNEIQGWKFVPNDSPNTAPLYPSSLQQSFSPWQIPFFNPSEYSHDSSSLTFAESCQLRLALEELKTVLSVSESRHHHTSFKSSSPLISDSSSNSSQRLKWFIKYLLTFNSPPTGSLRWALQEIARFPTLLHSPKQPPSLPSTLISSALESRFFSFFSSTTPQVEHFPIPQYSCEYDCTTPPTLPFIQSNSFLSFTSEESLTHSSTSSDHSSTESISAGLPPPNSTPRLDSSIQRMHRCLSLSDASSVYNTSCAEPIYDSRILGMDALALSRRSVQLETPPFQRLPRAHSTPLVKTVQSCNQFGPLQRICSRLFSPPTPNHASNSSPSSDVIIPDHDTHSQHLKFGPLTLTEAQEFMRDRSLLTAETTNHSINV